MVRSQEALRWGLLVGGEYQKRLQDVSQIVYSNGKGKPGKEKAGREKARAQSVFQEPSLTAIPSQHFPECTFTDSSGVSTCLGVFLSAQASDGGSKAGWPA